MKPALGEDASSYEYAYNDFGYVTSITYPDESTDVWVYSTDPDDLDRRDYGAVISYKNQNDQLTLFEIDHDTGDAISATRVVGLNDLESSETDDITTLFDYTAHGFLEQVTDPLFHVTKYFYHGTTPDLLDSVVVAYGTSDETTTSYDYDAADRVHMVTQQVNSSDSRTTEYLYDDLDRVIAVNAPDPDTGLPDDDFQTAFTYNLVGDLLTATDPLGHTATYKYNSHGRLIQYRAPYDSGIDDVPIIYNYEYNTVGNLIRVSDTLSRVTFYEYDTADRLQYVTGPSGQFHIYQYDDMGRVISFTINNADGANDETTTYEYNRMSQRTRMIEAAGTADAAETTFAYDSLGNLTGILDPLGNETLYHYDDLNRLDRITLPNSHERSYGYDDASRLTRSVDANGRATSYVYNARNELVHENWLDEFDDPFYTIDYDYDDAGQLVSAGDSSGDSLDYGYDYDLQGRLLHEHFADPVLTGAIFDLDLHRAYDAAGRVTSMALAIYGLPTAVLGSNAYEYYTDGRVSQVSQDLTGISLRAQFTYEPDGQLAGISRSSFDFGLNDWVEHVTTTFGYDSGGRLNSIVHDPTVGSDITYAYSYDPANRIRQIISSVDGTVDYDYDRRSQLTEADYSTAQPDEDYEYDESGNRVSANGENYDPALYNQLTSDDTFTYDYDYEGNLVEKTRISTDPADDYRTIYEYDHRNRLVRVTFEDESDAPTKIVHYTYDVHDRLIQKSVDLGADDDLDRAEYYRYDGTNVWFEAIDADGDGPADPALNFYLWGPAVDQLLARTDAENGQTLWMLADHQGTIRDLVDGQLGSPTEGEVVNHLTYDAYGQLLDQTASDPALQTRYGYTGQELDAETGLMYYNARWYDPRNGRFISEDPIGINGGDYNLSRYVGNSPTNGTDPSGNFTIGSGVQGSIAALIGGHGSIHRTFSMNGWNPLDWRFGYLITIGGGWEGGVGAAAEGTALGSLANCPEDLAGMGAALGAGASGGIFTGGITVDNLHPLETIGSFGSCDTGRRAAYNAHAGVATPRVTGIEPAAHFTIEYSWGWSTSPREYLNKLKKLMNWFRR